MPDFSTLYIDIPNLEDSRREAAPVPGWCILQAHDSDQLRVLFRRHEQERTCTGARGDEQASAGTGLWYDPNAFNGN